MRGWDLRWMDRSIGRGRRKGEEVWYREIGPEKKAQVGTVT